MNNLGSKIGNKFKEILSNDGKDYYRETRFKDGSILIESKDSSSTVSLYGGKGFTEQYYKDFHQAMIDSTKELNKE